MVNINQDVMLTHHFKLILNIYFRLLIFNVVCDKIIEELDDSGDEFSSNFQKNDTASNPKDFL